MIGRSSYLFPMTYGVKTVGEERNSEINVIQQEH
jgi:hypothetical protein